MSDVSTTLLGASLVICPAALELPRALVEWVTMLVVTREGDRRCKLRPSRRAMVTLVHLREHTTLAKTAAGFGISESTGRVIHLLAECDRVGDGRADCSHCEDGDCVVLVMA